MKFVTVWKKIRDRMRFETQKSRLQKLNYRKNGTRLSAICWYWLFYFCLYCCFVYFLKNGYGCRLFVHAYKTISNRRRFSAFVVRYFRLFWRRGKMECIEFSMQIKRALFIIWASLLQDKPGCLYKENSGYSKVGC